MLYDTIQSVWFYSMMNPKKNLEQQRGMINHFTKNVCHFWLKLLFCIPLYADIFVVAVTINVLILFEQTARQYNVDITVM